MGGCPPRGPLQQIEYGTSAYHHMPLFTHISIERLFFTLIIYLFSDVSALDSLFYLLSDTK